MWWYIGGGIAGLLLLCCIGVIVFSLVAGGGVFALVQATAGPRMASQGYFDAVGAHDWAKAQSYLNSSQRKTVSPQSLQTIWSPREAANGPVTGFSVTSTNINNNTAIVRGTVRYRNGVSEARTIDLVKEGSNWKISSLP